MASVNKVILIGNLGADPEVRYTAAGKAVGDIRVATTFKSGDNETTEWHRVVLWEKLAEVASQFLHKGDPVYIEGRIATRSWDDKDGNKKYTTEVVAERMQLLGSRKAADASETAPAEETPKAKRGRKPKFVEPLSAVDGDDDPFAA